LSMTLNTGSLEVIGTFDLKYCLVELTTS
jgi:hypothetical protein